MNKMEIKKGEHFIHLSEYTEEGRYKINVMTGSYMELSSIELNRTEAKRVIKWLEKAVGEK